MINLFKLNKNLYKICAKTFSDNLQFYRSSLIKDLFVCKLNLDLMDYPELNSKKEVEETNEISKDLKREMNEDKRKYLSLFDPGLKYMQRCKLAESFETQGYTSCLNLVTYSAMTEVVNMWGLPDQKMKYLAALKSETIHGAFLHSQPWDSPGIVAQVAEDGSKFILNGPPMKVSNLPESSLILVAAQLNNHKTSLNERTAFLIDSSSAGVYLNIKDNKVQLVNVEVPSDNVLGAVGCGEKILRRAMVTQSLVLSSICCSKLKSLLSQCSKFSNERHVFNVPLSSYEKVQQRLVSLCTEAFLSESMIYFVAGHLDDDGNKDWLTEGLATQVFCQEALRRATDQMVELFSHNCFELEGFESKIRGSLDLAQYQVSSKSDREMIGRECLQHFLTNYLEMKHSWIMDIGYKLGIVSDVRFVNEDNQALSILSFLHPSVAFVAQHFFINLRKFSEHLDSIRETYGEDLLLDSHFLANFSEWILDLWPVITAFSRVNRAHCLQLPTCKHQMNILTTHYSKLHHDLNRKLGNKDLEPKVEEDLLSLSKGTVCSRNGLPHPIDI